MCAIPPGYPLGFDVPLVVDLSDEVGRPVALSESAGADNDLKYATGLGGCSRVPILARRGRPRSERAGVGSG